MWLFQTSLVGIFFSVHTSGILDHVSAFNLELAAFHKHGFHKNKVSTLITKMAAHSSNDNSIFTRREAFTTTSKAAIATAVLSQRPESAEARLEPVNRPDLLPTEKGLNVIQIEKFLTNGQAKRMNDMLIGLEKETGFRVRLLCQAYPKTPGLAITDYWDLGKEGQKDDKYIVLVVDQFGGKGNALNFNVGEGVKFALPNVFWTRLQGKYGSTFFIKENGIDIAIVNALEAVTNCLKSEDQYCVSVPDQGVSMKSLGF